MPECFQCNAANAADPWVEKLDDLVEELHGRQSYCCSQTVLAIGMMRLAITNPDLLRAMEGYCGGCCAGVCGALEGGAALLGLYLGKGTAAEPRSEVLKDYVRELTEAFRAYWKDVTCEGLIHGDDALHETLCPQLMAGTVEMAWSLLQEKGVNLSSRKAGGAPGK